MMNKRGRKQKVQNAPQRKPRMTMVWVDFGKDQALSGMSAPSDRSELIFYDENGMPVAPRYIDIGVGYDRPKGTKVMTRVRANSTDILTKVNDNLAGYDWVFAVDTNTKTIGAESTSVTAIVLLREILITGERWSAKIIPQPSLEVRDALVPPERLGWRHLLWLIKESHLEGRVAIFVDSELGEISALNKRERELLPGFLLPENTTLFYASSDVGRVELIGNKAFAECNRDARNLMARIQAGDSPVNDFQTNIPKFCRRYRLWEPPT